MLERVLQLYPDMRVLKLFDAYRYFYHDSLSEADLSAAVEMKRNYIRVAKGRDNRIGHNREALAEWFIEVLLCKTSKTIVSEDSMYPSSTVLPMRVKANLLAHK